MFVEGKKGKNAKEDEIEESASKKKELSGKDFTLG